MDTALSAFLIQDTAILNSNEYTSRHGAEEFMIMDTRHSWWAKIVQQPAHQSNLLKLVRLAWGLHF